MADCLGVLAELNWVGTVQDLNWTELAQIAASAFKSLSNAKSTIIQIYDAQLCSHTFPAFTHRPSWGYPGLCPFFSQGINKVKVGTCVQLGGWIVMEYVNLVTPGPGKNFIICGSLTEQLFYAFAVHFSEITGNVVRWSGRQEESEAVGKLSAFDLRTLLDAVS